MLGVWRNLAYTISQAHATIHGHFLTYLFIRFSRQTLTSEEMSKNAIIYNQG